MSGYALAAGLRLQQRYVLRMPLGTGGMSEVWQADDEVLRRPVAVKALAANLAADAGLRDGVRREARAVASLNHPHVTRVYDHGEARLPDGAIVVYLVMELLDGGSLAARLAAGPLPWPEAARVAGQVAGALAAAHRAGLVHRDVKPANVMLTPAGAKVLDFGLAALAGARTVPVERDRAAAAATPVEPPGIGTPAYAAPEWLVGAPPHPSADVYAVGALLYEALTGQPAVRARTWAEAVESHRRAAPPPPPGAPDLPPRLAALCLACLSPDPRQRPSAAAVAAVLDRPRPGGSPLHRLRTTVRRRADAAAGRWPRAAGLALLGVAAAGLLALVLVAGTLLDRRAPGRQDVVAGPVATASPAPGAPSVPVPPGTGPTPTPGTVPTGPPAPPVTPPVTPAQPPAGRPSPDAVAAEFDRRLAEAAAAGRVRADVAIDLRNGLNALRDRIALGRPADLRRTAVDLRRKLAERLAERAIDARTAAQLSTVLDPLLA